MRHPVALRRIAAGIVYLVCLGLAPTLPAADAEIAVLRINGLDAVVADAQRVAALAGAPIERDEILGPLAHSLHLADLSWVDREKPIVILMPTAGLMLGNQGILGALPVNNPTSAIAAIGRAQGVKPEEDEGVYTFPREDGTRLVATSRGGYLVVGMAPALVAGFDPRAALALADHPPGSVSAEIFLEPLAPMARMGLQMGRQAMEQQMQAELQQGAGEERDEDTTTPEIGPEALAPILDLYFGALDDLLNNTSRIQLSFEVTAGHVMLHQRWLPKGGSTFAGLLEVQRGGMPDLARYVDPAGAALVFAGQMSYTPEFIAALTSYLARYMEFVKSVGSSLQDQQDAAFLNRLFVGLGQDPAKWMSCYRGDGAGTLSVDAERGFRVSQVYGAQNPDLCRAWIDEVAGLMTDLPAGPDGEPLLDIRFDELQYQGVSALKQSLRLQLPAAEPEAEEAEKILSQWFGKDGTMVSFTGMKDGMVLSTTGSDAESAFRALVDRVSRKKLGGGILAANFAPLRLGPGFFGALDLAPLLDAVLGAQDAEGAEESLAFFRYLPEGGSRFVYGLRFGEGALNVDCAVPLDWVEAIGKASAAEREPAAPAPKQQPTGQRHG